MWFKSIILAAALVLQLPSPSLAQLPLSQGGLALKNIHLNYSKEFGLTGCSPLGDSAALLCLGWRDDALTTCLQWGALPAMAACIRRTPTLSSSFSLPFEFSQGIDVLPFPAEADWGYRFNFSIP